MEHPSLSHLPRRGLGATDDACQPARADRDLRCHVHSARDRSTAVSTAVPDLFWTDTLGVSTEGV